MIRGVELLLKLYLLITNQPVAMEMLDWILNLLGIGEEEQDF